MSVPAVVVAAPASGSGKTTVATGLMGALRAAGHRVAPFKVGPDYIDPGYHGLAAGRVGRNLDPVLTSPELVEQLFHHGSRGCDVAVVEGVMGLFDGRIDPGSPGPAAGSTAHVAALLGAPVVLVVDARGHSQSLAALLHGFATFDPRVRLGGVVLNQVGSDRHEEVLRAACAAVGLPVLGALRRLEALGVPSRHLGLVTAAEHGGAADAVAAMTRWVRGGVDLRAVLALARSSCPGPAWDPAPAAAPVGAAPVVVAVAAGAAFTFGYAEHRELLAACGARVVEFDPLRETLPDATAALVLPGGFPEAHAAELAANTALLAQVRAAAAAGMPVHAECAGLLYLCRDLDGTPMAGVLDAGAQFGPTLTLGYRDAVAVAPSPLFPAGSRVTGHEFHRTHLAGSAAASPAWAWRGPAGTVREGFAAGNVHASYLHTHPAAHPQAVARFVAAARAWQGGAAARAWQGGAAARAWSAGG